MEPVLTEKKSQGKGRGRIKRKGRRNEGHIQLSVCLTVSRFGCIIVQEGRVWLVSNVAQLHISSFCYGCWCLPPSLFSSPMSAWSTALVFLSLFFKKSRTRHTCLVALRLYFSPNPEPLIKLSSAPCCSLPLLGCQKGLISD